MTTINSSFKFKPNIRKRIFATLIDYGIYLLAFFLYVMFVGHEDDEGGKTVTGLSALPLFIFWFIYFVIIEAIFGATLGHQGLNLKVLTINRRNISLAQALKRHLLDPIDFLFYGIPAIIAIKNSDKHQRIGDMWAQTFIVDMTDPEQYSDVYITTK